MTSKNGSLYIQSMIPSIIEYFRCFSWVPTEKTRCITIFQVAHVKVVEKQRLFFGRWGRFKWRKVQRFAITEVVN